MKPLVIALGGNALLKEHQMGKFSQQMENVKSVCKELAAIYKSKKQPLLLTHGNGPQVGNLELQMQSMIPKIPSMPLHVEVGMTQGQIGHMLEIGLKHYLPLQKIAVLLTHVEVNPKDKAFSHPSKPIGPWYSKFHSKELQRKKIPLLFDSRKGYRKLVASPLPKKIIELPIIEEMLESNDMVIACGGGGIPVVKKYGAYVGVEAVIDKDFSSQVIANALHAKTMMILTNEHFVYTNYHSAKPKPWPNLSRKKATHFLHKGEFDLGSMHPKIEAGLHFLARGGKEVLIGHTHEAEKVIFHEKGTRLH